MHILFVRCPCVRPGSHLKTCLMMTDLEVGFDGVERPRPSGGDCSLPASALTKQKAGGRNPGSGEGREGGPKFATRL